jgi:hypothetical protein
MSQPYAGLQRIEHLKQRQHWPSALVSLFYYLAYRTSLLLGKSKTDLVKKVIEHVLSNQTGASPSALDVFDKSFRLLVEKEQERAKVDQKYSRPTLDLFLTPEEALRRLRYFSEEYLNREFDIFLDLLPDAVLDAYFSLFFSIRPGGSWNVIGNSPDFYVSRSASFMQPDTLAYNVTHGILIAVELKIDAPLQKEQILNYCRMAALLEADGLTDPGTEFKILVISADGSRAASRGEDLIAKAKSQLAAGCKGWRCNPDEAARREKRTAEVLGALELRFSSWQALGEYFAADLKRCRGVGLEQSYTKLVEGFLNSLAEKYSHKQASVLYDRNVK